MDESCKKSNKGHKKSITLDFFKCELRRREFASFTKQFAKRSWMIFQ